MQKKPWKRKVGHSGKQSPHSRQGGDTPDSQRLADIQEEEVILSHMQQQKYHLPDALDNGKCPGPLT